MQRVKTGFTLIEMLIVMAIVSLLLTIALPRYFGSLDKAKVVALKENLQILRVTIDKYSADKGVYPNDLEELVSQRYLRAVPVDPITESASTWVLIPSRDPEVRGIIDVKSGAQGVTRDGQAYGSL